MMGSESWLRRITWTVALLLLSLPLLGSDCDETSTSGPEIVGDPVSIAPFDVLRHASSLYGLWHGEAFSLAVGSQGRAFILTEGRRFRLPTGSTSWLRGAHYFGDLHGALLVGESVGADPAPVILHYRWGVRNRVQAAWTGDARCILGYANTVAEVGIGDTTWDYDGFDWTPGPLSYGVDIYDLGPFDLRACADGIYKADCPNAPCYVHATTVPVTGMSGLDDDRVMAVAGEEILRTDDGLHFATAFSPGFHLNDISWAATDWAVAVGNEGITCVYNGDSWQILQADTDADLKAVCAWQENGAPRALAVGGHGAEYRFENGGWTGEQYAAESWSDVMGDPQSTLFGILGGRLMRYDGDWHAEPATGAIELTQLCCLAADSVWAIGRQGMDSFLARFNGAAWQTQWLASMETARDLWVADVGNIFVACDYGTVFSSAGHWVPEIAVQPPQHLRGIWGASAQSVYVVGENGTIAHYDGLDWSPMASGTGVHLNAICGSGDEHIVAVGDDATVLRFDGEDWLPMAVSATGDLTLVWTDGPDNIWLGSAADELHHYNGAVWQHLTTGFPENASMGLWGRDEDLWIVGQGDLVLEYLSPEELPSALDRF